MKTIFLIASLALTTTVFSQICPKNYEIHVETTFETLNQSDGEIEVTYFSGGTSPYTYDWSTGGSSSTISNLSAGIYTATVTDANSCMYTFCTFINRDSLPCQSTLMYDPCGDTIPINYQFWTRKQPSQTGVVVELYDENGDLVTREVITTFTATGFYFFLTDSMYYNETYGIVTKGIFNTGSGTDTSEFCGDTCMFTIEDFRCENPWVGSYCDDTVAIANQFSVQAHPHMTGVLVQVYDNSNSLVSTVTRTNKSGGAFIFSIPNEIYYDSTFSIITSGIYNPGDTSGFCGDTCTFTVDGLPEDYAWVSNSCQDTVNTIHQFWVQRHFHQVGAIVEIYAADCSTLVATVTTENQTGTGFWLSMNGIAGVTVDDDYCIVARGYFQDIYPGTENPDTALVGGDTCTFHLTDPGAFIKNDGGYTGRNSRFSSSNSIGVFPNPAKDQLNITNLPFSNSETQEIEIRVLDLKGAVIKRIFRPNDSKVSLNVKDLIDGVYVVQVLQNGVLFDESKVTLID